MMHESRLERRSHFTRRGRVREGPRLELSPIQQNLISARRREHFGLDVAEQEPGRRFDVVVRRSTYDVTRRKRRGRKRRRKNIFGRMTGTTFRCQTSEGVRWHRKVFLVSSVGAAIAEVSVLRVG